MTAMELMKYVDHTLLKTSCKWSDISILCEESIRFKTASVCIPPSFIKKAREKYGSNLTICTVIGFPLGYNTTETKVFETENALKNTADEIDMVINQNWVKDCLYKEIEDEIRKVKAICGERILKVIIEISNLENDEIIKMCDVVSKSGADYIKTSTGFSEYGATFEAVKIIKDSISTKLKIKASGGIRTRKDMEKYIFLGCSRLGTSSAVSILKSEL